jgi:hypothetical protein
VVARGERWRRPWGLGSGVWAGARVCGERHWHGGARTARGDGWRHVGIGGVAATLGTKEWHVGRG